MNVARAAIGVLCLVALSKQSYITITRDWIVWGATIGYVNWDSAGDAAVKGMLDLAAAHQWTAVAKRMVAGTHARAYDAAVKAAAEASDIPADFFKTTLPHAFKTASAAHFEALVSLAARHEAFYNTRATIAYAGIFNRSTLPEAPEIAAKIVSALRVTGCPSEDVRAVIMARSPVESVYATTLAACPPASIAQVTELARDAYSRRRDAALAAVVAYAGHLGAEDRISDWGLQRDMHAVPGLAGISNADIMTALNCSTKPHVRDVLQYILKERHNPRAIRRAALPVA